MYVHDIDVELYFVDHAIGTVISNAADHFESLEGLVNLLLNLFLHGLEHLNLS